MTINTDNKHQFWKKQICLLIFFSWYQIEIQLNKANTSDIDTSFLYLNIKIIGSNIET